MGEEVSKGSIADNTPGTVGTTLFCADYALLALTFNSTKARPAMTSIWPFKKETLKPDRLPLDGPWTIFEGHHDGRTMFVRTNMAYREYGSVEGYEHQVGIAVPLKNAASSGLPTPEENAQLGEIEDAICGSLEEQAESLLVAVITTSGMKEFVLYSREPQSVKRRFEQLCSRITSHEMQLMIQADSTWRTYARFGG
jgi:hypothetical protein